MKATLHDMEDYIFTRVVLPLKDLTLPSFDNLQSPIDGLSLYVEKDDSYINAHRGRFNYQRDMAIEQAPLVIIMSARGFYGVIGRLDKKNRKLTLYSTEAQRAGLGHVVSKIHAMFYNYPQYKVEMKGRQYD